MIELRVDDRIVLTSVEIEDAEQLFALTDGSREYLREWLPWVDRTLTVGDTKSFISSTVKQQANKDGFTCCIWYEGKLAGVIGLVHVKWANRTTQVGYWLGQNFQGNGIVTKCCRTLVDYLFYEMDLNRVEIRVAVGNERSRAIPKRLGFILEGTIRDGEWLGDHYVDNVIFGMLRKDWPNERAR